ncbi:MAG: hypothetical protein VKK59_02850 [Vampirovibrionales bacterium]|nr:hypothetical protein [Vampirovibrionales bacterium]
MATFNTYPGYSSAPFFGIPSQPGTGPQYSPPFPPNAQVPGAQMPYWGGPFGQEVTTVNHRNDIVGRPELAGGFGWLLPGLDPVFQNTFAAYSNNLNDLLNFASGESVGVFFGSTPANPTQSPGFAGASFFNNVDPSAAYQNFYNYTPPVTQSWY